jgi:hypothetical protein
LLVRLLYHQGTVNWEGFELETAHSLHATQGLLKRLRKQYLPEDKGEASAPPKTPKKASTDPDNSKSKPPTPKLTKEEKALKKQEREAAKAKRDADKAAKEAEKAQKVCELRVF